MKIKKVNRASNISVLPPIKTSNDFQNFHRFNQKELSAVEIKGMLRDSMSRSRSRLARLVMMEPLLRSSIFLLLPIADLRNFPMFGSLALLVISFGTISE
jgi:hypothetical protein